MENYKKGNVVKDPLERDKIPIPNLPKDFLWMQVNSGSKVPHLIRHTMGIIADGCRSVVWTGSGGGLPKAISCAELIKRDSDMTYQITKIGYRKCEEYWEPQIDGLEKLVVKRDVPIIHILLSLEPLDSNESGYQLKNDKNAFWQSSDKSQKDRGKQKPKVTPDDVAAMGLQSEKAKGKRNLGRNFRKIKKDPSMET